MKEQDTIRNLHFIALKTSLVIGALFVVHALNHIPFSVPVFLPGLFTACLFPFLIWTTNIYLVRIREKHEITPSATRWRYLISYLVNSPIIGLLVVILPRDFIQIMLVDTGHPIQYPFSVGILLNTIVLVIQESVLLRSKKALVELENARLRISHAEALNQQLKQQIHPHFLFNALNILKALIRKDPDSAEDYLVRLSDFLRVSLSSNNQNKVKLEDELKLCTDYMEMQRLRFGNALEYAIDIPEPIRSSGSVPGFSIQLLLENAIKHNWLTRESPLRISVTGKDGFITVGNNLQPKQSTEITSGLGLPNLAERYRILDGEGVQISSDEKEFRVRIKILGL
ncbi:MAG: histidine kinase [Prolixibacteraceae bacterium]